MSFAKKIGAALLFAVFLALGTFPFATGPTPFRPWKIVGSVSANENYTTLHMTVHSDGKPVLGLNVQINGHPAEDRGNGLYSCLVQEPLDASGAPLAVTLRLDAASQAAPTLTATITPGKRIAIGSPRDDSTVPSLSQHISASWTGGVAPYTLTLQEAQQPNATVYSAQNLAGTTHQVSLSNCRPGSDYLLSVFCKAGKFTFDHPVDSSSSFYLIQRSPYVHIHVE